MNHNLIQQQQHTMTDELLEQMFEIEKQESPLLIEGTLRHQNNLIIAKSKYGNIFKGIIIDTNYFNDNKYIPTLVCKDDPTLILGKPRYPDKFVNNEYEIKLCDRHNCGLFCIELSNINDNSKRNDIPTTEYITEPSYCNHDNEKKETSEVKLFINENAKKFVRKLVKRSENIESDFLNNINRWLNENNDVKCYALYGNDNIKVIILLSKCDYDPQKKHLNPFILDYIYTFLEYRRQKLAYRMLLHIKSKEQITAFCSTDESEHLFRKADYKFSGYDKRFNILPVFRFP